MTDIYQILTDLKRQRDSMSLAITVIEAYVGGNGTAALANGSVLLPEGLSLNTIIDQAQSIALQPAKKKKTISDKARETISQKLKDSWAKRKKAAEDLAAAAALATAAKAKKKAVSKRAMAA